MDGVIGQISYMLKQLSLLLNH